MDIINNIKQIFKGKKSEVPNLVQTKNSFETTRYSQTRKPIYQVVQSANADYSVNDRTEMLRLARFFADNTPIAKSLLNLTSEYSSDVEFYPATKTSKFNVAAKAYWDKWSDQPDMVSKKSLKQLKRMTTRSRLIDGDVFLIKQSSPNSGKPRIRLVESHQVKTPPDLKDKEGVTIFDGVKIDKDTGRPLGYYIELSEGKFTFVDEFNVIIEANILRPGQYRGISNFASIMETLRQWKEMNDNETHAIKDTTLITKVFHTNDGELQANIPNSVQTNPYNVGNNKTNATKVKKPSVAASVPGSLVMDKDERLELIQSTRPSDQVQKFWQMSEARICVGFGIPIELVFPERQTGATQRAILEIADSFFKSQALITEEVYYEIYKWVISYGIKHDPDAPKELKNPPEDWKEVTVTYPQSPGIDSTRNSTAILNEWRAGIRPIQSVVAELGLGDFQTIARQNAEASSIVNDIYEEYKDKGVTKEEILNKIEKQIVNSIQNPNIPDNSNK